MQIAIPEGKEVHARKFYCERLGLREVPKPAELQGRGGLWLEGDSVSLHLGVETPFQPARKAHVGLAVQDLDAARTALMDFQPTAISQLPGFRRFYLSDPFGNRIEILEQDPSDTP